MPRSVVIPVRLVIDSGCRERAVDLAAEPMTTALEGALERAGRDVFEPSGMQAIADRPTFAWTGNGLPTLTEKQRAEIEQQVSDLIARASRRAGLEERTEQGTRDRDAQRPSEPYDPARDTGDGYILDSYAGPKSPPNQQTVGKSGTKAATTKVRTRQSPPQVKFKAFPDAVRAAWGLHAEIVKGLLAEGEKLPFTGVFGTIFANGGADHLCIYYGTVSEKGVRPEYALQYSKFVLNTVDVSHGTSLKSGVARAKIDVSAGYFAITKLQSFDAAADAISFVAERWRIEFLKEELLDRVGRELFKKQGGQGNFEANRETFLKEAARHVVERTGAITGPCTIYARTDGILMAMNRQVEPFRIVIAFSAQHVAAQAEAKAPGEGKEGGSAADGQPDPQQTPAPTTESADGATESSDGAPDDEARDCIDNPFDKGRTIEVVVGNKSYDFSIDPFECEHDITRLGALGESLAMSIRRLVDILELPEADYRYAARFAIEAMMILEARSLYAKHLGCGQPLEVRPNPAGKGNLGDADMQAGPSLALDRLRRYVTAAEINEQMIEMVYQAYKQPIRMPGRKPRKLGNGWTLHFLEKVRSPRASMVGRIFSDTCAVMMMQSLVAAQRALDGILRPERFGIEFKVVYPAMTGVLRTAGKLEELRDRLIEAEGDKLSIGVWPPTGLLGRLLDDTPFPHSWGEFKRSIKAKLSSGYSVWQDVRAHANSRATDWYDDYKARSGVAGKAKYLKDGTVVVVDETGKHWTREDLESQIKIRVGIAGNINPLVKHMHNLRGAYSAFSTTEEAARDYFRFVLERMQSANGKARDKVLDSDDFAVEVGHTSADKLAEMGGIHRIAYDALATSFKDRSLLDRGVRNKLEEIEDAATAWTVVETGLTIGLGLLYAPLGLAVGAVFVISRLSTALDHGNLAEGLLDPEAIISAAEAEMELFFSCLEIAMMAVPELPQLSRAVKAIGAAKGELKVVASKAAGQTARGLPGKSQVRNVLSALATELGESIAAKLMVQVGMALLLPKIMDRIFKPLADAAMGEANLQGGFEATLAALIDHEGEGAVEALLKEVMAEGVGSNDSIAKAAERGLATGNGQAVPGLGVPRVLVLDEGES